MGIANWWRRTTKPLADRILKSAKSDPTITHDEYQAIYMAYARTYVLPVVAADFRVDDSVQVKTSAGFSRGATGVVVDVDKESGRVWVLREQASTALWFYPNELEKKSK